MLDVTELLEQIDLAISKDQGAAYDRLLQFQLTKLMAQPPVEPSATNKIGASQIGITCDRHLYYIYTKAPKTPYKANLLRIFSRGKYEEARLITCLKLIGLTVLETDSNNKQFEFSYFEGRFSGHADGIVIDKENNKYVLEMKTSNTQNFQKLVRKGMRDTHPRHYAQVQAYMLGLNLDTTLYFVVDKNTDLLYIEFITKDINYCRNLLTKAYYIITAENEESCAKISPYASYVDCKMCEFRTVCHKISGNFIC